MSGLPRWLSNLSKPYTFLPGLMISLFQKEFLSKENLKRARALHEIASGRGQTLAQMAIAWVLRDERVTSALIGAHSVEQLDNALETLQFTHSELNKIDRCAQEGALTFGEMPRRGEA